MAATDKQIREALCKHPELASQLLQAAGKERFGAAHAAWKEATSKGPYKDPEDGEELDLAGDPLLEGFGLYLNGNGDAGGDPIHDGAPFLFDDDEEAERAAKALAKHLNAPVLVCFEEWDHREYDVAELNESGCDCLDSMVREVVEHG